MRSDNDKAKETLKRRTLAAKGLKERGDGRPVDPMKDIGSDLIDIDPHKPQSVEEKERKISNAGLATGLAKGR